VLQEKTCRQKGDEDMITIYTTPSCSSCRKAKKWLDQHQLPYEEKNLFSYRITSEDISLMLKNSDNGFEDIISTRSKVFKDQELDPDNMTVSELKEFILDNPSVLKRPIIVDDTKMQVGYNDEEIRVFVPKRLRDLVMCKDCPDDGVCDYQTQIKKYFDEIKAE
jgi:regulatory protein spx